ncbi:MAG: NAD-dependent epimerase/dehydratase family protein [candidate division Zixibacteria bacterium]|nr:NAD-dependent epimerase/dehydratase family protein [candidate division Zixibacteria bacterium]
MHVLITGGAGFIGSHTADALLKRGYGVRILDSLEPPVHQGVPSYLASDVELVRGDVRNRNDMTRALDGVEAVIHLAAYQDYLPDFSRFFHVNSVGTALLYEIIVERHLPIRKIVIASSQAVYGEGPYDCPEHGRIWPQARSLEQLEHTIWDIVCPRCHASLVSQSATEDTVNPGNSYAISKHTQETIGFTLGRRYGLPTAALRYSIVQGPRQSFSNAYSGACRIFSLRAHFGQPPLVYEDGGQLRDYVNIHDVVDANLLALEQTGTDGEAYNVGGGKAIRVEAFARIVTDVFGIDVRPEIPGKFRFGDTRHIVSDISKLSQLGWRPQRSTTESVRAYRDWLRQQPDVKNFSTDANRTMESLQVVRHVRTDTGTSA